MIAPTYGVHKMEVGNGISINLKVMKKLVLTKIEIQ
tara:strand:+ start:178 stop:285 length:108 start_codon:yes stop_codon:yes gene_type:complete